MKKTALRFQNTNTPRQVGEVGRLKIVRGPDQGALFVIVGAISTIGRGTECDVQLSDPKTSRKHAEISRTDKGAWSIRDFGSSNGIQLNERQVKQSPINSGDFVSMGETTFEFASSVGEQTKMLMSPPMDANVQRGWVQAREREQRRVERIAKFGGGVSQPSPKGDSGGKKFSPITLLALGIGGFFLFFIDNKPKTVPKPKTAQQAKAEADQKSEEAGTLRNLAAYLPRTETTEDSKDAPKTVESFYRAGFREFTKGNYLRAKRQFETALQIDPAHLPSRSYLTQTEKAIDDEIEGHLFKGKKSLDSGQLRISKGHFEAVLRLLFKDRDNPRYREAEHQLEKIEQSRKGTSG